MLEYIRSSAQSFGVKIAFGVIILVFVFWGVGNFNDRDYTNVVAVVNGQPILAMEFEKAYQAVEDSILRSNPGITREQLASQHLGRQVLRDLIEQTLLAQEAQRSGVEISPVELRAHAAQIPAFQDVAGRFDPEAYKRVLAARRMTPAQYEHELGNQLLQEKMFNLVTAPAWVDPDEALRRFNFLREKRIINYIFVPASRFEPDVKVSDKEIADWYEGHKDEFAIPAKLDISFIQLRPENLADAASFSSEEVQKRYEIDSARYTEPEQVKVSHILVTLTEDASEDEIQKARNKMAEIKAELDKGQPFAVVADKYNAPNAAGKGGELGWIGRGATVPAFEEAAFNAEPGIVTEEIRTPFGLHILLVEEKKPGGLKPLAEVEANVRKSLAAEKGADKLHEVLDALIEDNIMDKPLAESAKRYGLKLEQTGLISRDELAERFALTPGDADLLFSVQPGMPLDVALAAGESYLVVRALKAEPASVRPFDDVKQDIRQSLIRQGALKDAMKIAANILQEVREKDINSQELQNYELKKDITVSREGDVPGFFPDPSLVTDIFDTKPGNWVPEAHAVAQEDGSGAMLVYVDKVLSPSTDDFAAVERVLTSASKRQRQDAIFSIFMGKLADGAKIEITNSNLIDRVN